MAIDKYVHQAAAIVEAFMPALQTPVLAETLFGHMNRWGKLPITYYASPLPWNMTDMDMTTGEGRTYRYFKGNTVYRFGDGLSYTEFEHHCTCPSTVAETSEIVSLLEKESSASLALGQALQCQCHLTNVGAMVCTFLVHIFGISCIINILCLFIC